MSRPSGIDWLAWWQLLRAANVFTAASNVIAGFLLVRHEWQPAVPLLLLVLSSVLLYEGGMVLNDVFDAEVDSVERPERPIPARRVNQRAARNLGVGLLLGGVLAAHAVSWLTDEWLSAQLALALAITILGYNAGWKNTRWGPLSMGGCRALNVLLGGSLVDLGQQTTIWCYAAAIGIYTVVITYLARGEHLDSSGIIKKHVSRLIQMFILLDAIASTLAAGLTSGLIVLSLLIPTRLLARRLPMT